MMNRMLKGPVGYALGFLLLALPLAALPSPKQKKASASGSPSAEVKDGENLFKQNCEMCHYADKTDKKLGPGLKDLFKNKELVSNHKPVTDANVREQIEKGSPDAKPMPMPGFGEKLSADQINDLIAYLKTL